MMATRASQFRAVAPASVEQRRAERHPVFITRASVRRHKQAPAEAALHDLSVYGCRVACDSDHAPEDRVWLRFEGGVPIPATVIWCADGFIGCRFDTPIARTLLRTLTLSAA